jgi:protein required for attachment to host cells
MKSNDTRNFFQSIQPVWYVVANRTEAVIYREGRDHHFQFIQRLSNASGKKTETELDSDRPGRGSSSAGSGTIRHSLDRRFHRHEEMAKRFARRIVRTLEAGNLEGRFGAVVLVAEPHFLGLLRATLSKPLRERVRASVPREFAQGSDLQIRAHIFSALAS